MTDWRNPKTNDAFLEWRNTFPEQHWSKNDLSACRLGFDAGYAAGRDEGLEEAAHLVEVHGVSHGSDGGELKPRMDGDRNGLTYAAAIREKIGEHGNG